VSHATRVGAAGPQLPDAGPASDTGAAGGRWLLPVLVAAAFLVFAQAFMVAPLIPRLAQVFGADTATVGLAVPAYLLPYGLATLVAWR